MFGRPPKPGSRKAGKEYDRTFRELKDRRNQTWIDSQAEVESRWNSYALDHPGAEAAYTKRTLRHPGGEVEYHPVYEKLQAEHYQRMNDYDVASRDTLNGAARRLLGYHADNPNWELHPTPQGAELEKTRNKMLNSQQFGHLPEYGENY